MLRVPVGRRGDETQDQGREEEESS